jgi:hypothetical protein
MSFAVADAFMQEVGTQAHARRLFGIDSGAIAEGVRQAWASLKGVSNGARASSTV